MIRGDFRLAMFSDRLNDAQVASSNPAGMTKSGLMVIQLLNLCDRSYCSRTLLPYAMINRWSGYPIFRLAEICPTIHLYMHPSLAVQNQSVG